MYSLDQNYVPPTHFDFLKSPLEKIQIFKFEVLLYRMGSLDFNDVAVTRMQIFTIGCLRISISHNIVSVQLSHECESTRTLACRVQILSK
jgi:hypothetical protein